MAFPLLRICEDVFCIALVLYTIQFRFQLLLDMLDEAQLMDADYVTDCVERTLRSSGSTISPKQNTPTCPHRCIVSETAIEPNFRRSLNTLYSWVRIHIGAG